MSDRITDTIATALGRHSIERSLRIGGGERKEWWNCIECDWVSEIFEIGSVSGESLQRDHHAAVIVAALKAQRIAVVELPQDVIIPTGWGDDCLGAWPTTSETDPVSAWPGHQVVTPDDRWMPSRDARSLEAALLAAADAAEAVSGG
ncbi:hypothetical protein B1R94_02130 [Mycolicibacterium litorale]|nr:hypothetical protein B1R94_02130 [Mycolicibacterium litorale]